MVFEIDAPGTEFYIILEGVVEFYGKYSKEDEELAKKFTEAVKKEKELPIESKPRVKSNYEGK